MHDAIAYAAAAAVLLVACRYVAWLRVAAVPGVPDAGVAPVSHPQVALVVQADAAWATELGRQAGAILQPSAVACTQQRTEQRTCMR
jgi:hypothetical protein